MRRPSRQGPILVCKPGTDSITAEINSQEKSVSFSAPSATFYLAFILLGATFTSDAQNLGENVHYYFNEVRKGHYPASSPSLLTGMESFNILQPFLRDSSSVVREKAYELFFSMLLHSPDSAVRNDGVLILLSGCKDKDAGIRATAAGFLRQFDKIDFNLSAKDSLSKFIRSKISPLDQLIKLAGFLNLVHLLPNIRTLSQAGNPPHLRWAALQSLARMGEANAIEDMMQRVRRLPVNDDIVYKIFPDLIFTRHRELIAYVVEALQSDQKNCHSADIEREIAMPCGYRIMEQLAPVIEDFPLELDETGDLKTNDYREALTTVRQWFKKNQTYVIMNDRY